MKKLFLFISLIFGLLSYSQVPKGFRVDLGPYLSGVADSLVVDSTAVFGAVFRCDENRKIKSLTIYYTFGGEVKCFAESGFNNANFDTIYQRYPHEKYKVANSYILPVFIQKVSEISQPLLSRRFTARDVNASYTILRDILQKHSDSELLSPTIFFNLPDEY